MCNCKDIEIGSYGNQIELPAPKHLIKWAEKADFSLGGERNTVCVDRCLEEEIKELWAKGITTTGCCCGHNKVAPYIGVIADDIHKMKGMGYRQIGEEDFEPKSLSDRTSMPAIW